MTGLASGLLGVDLAAASPAAALASLRYGPWVERTVCAAPAAPTSTAWLRMTATPLAEPGRPIPSLQILLVSSVASGTVFDIVIEHSDIGGLAFLIGCASEAQRERAARLLSPEFELERVRRPPERPGWPRLGLVHRLHADAAAGADGPAIDSTLLDRLTGIDGAWRVWWRLEAVATLPLDEGLTALEEAEGVVAGRVTSTVQRSTTVSNTVVDAGWTRVVEWLGALHAHLAEARAVGGWLVESYVSGASGAEIDTVVASLRAGVPVTAERGFVADALTVASGSAAATDLWPPTSLLTAGDLTALLAPARTSVTGLVNRPGLPVGRNSPATADPLTLGRYSGTAVDATIDLADLEGHAFIVGTTGSGKSTTVSALLAGAWNTHGIPFLLLDPVKDDYAGFGSAFEGGVQVLRGRDLTLNVLQEWPGTDARAHVARIAQAFRGSFTMPSPAPYVVTQLFDRLLTQPGGAGHSTLFDVRDTLDGLVDSLGYAPENTANIRAVIGTRLNLLLSPLRAHRFAWPHSRQLESLFERPTVVSLADVPDDDERSLLVLVLALACWSRARARSSAATGRSAAAGTPRRVDHLLVLEEAHRIIPDIDPSGDPEHGSARAESSALLASMLAEVRSLGEQVLVLDQSPSRVSAEVLRNTNLKIAHRILHPRDQEQVAGAIGLDDDRKGLLGSLSRGQVLVSSSAHPAPQAVTIGPPTRLGGRPRNPAASDAGTHAAGWPCCRGSRTAGAAEAHFAAWHAAESAADAAAFFLVAVRRGEGDGEAAREWSASRLVRAARANDVSTPCLMWAALRGVITRERRLGLVKSANSFGIAHEEAFAAWQSGDAATRVLHEHARSIPGPATTCAACGTACRVRVPAQMLGRTPRRSPLGLLHSPQWRDGLPELTDFLAARAQNWQPLLGEPASLSLVGCLTFQSVQSAGLDDDVAESLLTRVRKRSRV